MRDSARKNIEKRTAYSKKYRKEHPEWWKNYMKKYREENKEHIARLHKPIADIWHKNSCKNLSDTYVINKIAQKSGLKRIDIEPHTELIDAWRQNIKIKRLIIN